MRAVARWIIVAIVLAHGGIHLLGAAKGLAGAGVSQLTRPISTGMGVAWLATAVLVIGSGLVLARSVRWWWIVGAVALVASQAVIFTAWSDARGGTVVNVVLLLAVLYGYASQGPGSYRSEFRRRSQAALNEPLTGGVVTEDDLARLPDSVAAYVRQSGAVGQARVTNFQADISGRIRSGPTARWMPFRGEQVNTYGPTPARLFYIDATMLGVPLDVLHVFVGPSATMRVKAGSLLRMVNAAGPEMDRGETVTVFNDLCVLAPSALVDAPVAWEAIDANHARGNFTRGAHTVAAELVFNDAHELIDFISDDRLAASADGRHFVAQRWSTPLRGYRSFGANRLAAIGEGRWHAPDPEGEFTYIEFHVDNITYNAGMGRRIPERGEVARHNDDDDIGDRERSHGQAA
ncbi:MAG: hypothetical protein QOG64_2953 [Acidimicrobiaceae bacterium]|nr:hypothetical protein [Acidimicrobiaceae bacterium]